MNRRGQHSQFKAYFTAHYHALALCFKRIISHRLANILAILVTSIALLLPSLLLVTLNNLKQITEHVGNGTQLHVYLDRNINDNSLNLLVQKIQSQQGILHVDSILPRDGLNEFIEQTNSGDLINDLSENPLEPLLLVTPRANRINPQELNQLKKWLSTLPQVTQVSLDNLWITRLQVGISLLEKMFWGLVAIFSLAVVVVIASFSQNTSNHYQEQINLLYTVGATPTYIRRPFLYSGLFIGLIAGILAVIGVLVAQKWLNPTAHHLAQLYQVEFNLQSLTTPNIMIMLLSSSILGYIGSFAAISSKLRRQK